MKFNTETYYESQRLFTRLKKLPNVRDVAVNDNKLLLISKKNNKLIEVVEVITIDEIVIDDLTYIRLNDILSLLSLSRKTRPEGNDDDMYLLGDNDDEPEE